MARRLMFCERHAAFTPTRDETPGRGVICPDEGDGCFATGPGRFIRE